MLIPKYIVVLSDSCRSLQAGLSVVQIQHDNNNIPNLRGSWKFRNLRGSYIAHILSSYAYNIQFNITKHNIGLEFWICIMICVLRRRFRPRVINSRSIFETILLYSIIVYRYTNERVLSTYRIYYFVYWLWRRSSAFI